MDSYSVPVQKPLKVPHQVLLQGQKVENTAMDNAVCPQIINPLVVSSRQSLFNGFVQKQPKDAGAASKGAPTYAKLKVMTGAHSRIYCWSESAETSVNYFLPQVKDDFDTLSAQNMLALNSGATTGVISVMGAPQDALRECSEAQREWTLTV